VHDKKGETPLESPPAKQRPKVIPLFQEHAPIKKEGKKIMDPEKLMDELSKELSASLKAMSKAKTAEEKKLYSEVVKNLSDSLGVFLGLISDMMMDYDLDDFKE
jgi:hypothetical protein